MKKTLLFAMTAMALKANASGIPTVDVAAIANQVQAMTVEASRWEETVEQYQKEYENMQERLSTAKDTLNTMQGIKQITGGVKDFQDMVGNISDIDYWLANSKDVLKNGSSLLTPELKEKFDALGFTEQCKTSNDEKSKICEGKIIVNVMRDAANENYTEQLKEKITQLENISSAAAKSQDIKTSQDYANQIASLRGSIQALQAQITLSQSIGKQLDVQAEQIEKERLAKYENDYSAWDSD